MRWPAGVPQRLLLALAFVSIPVGLAAEDGRVLIVLDGSNSMWGRVDGTEKIVVAREVLAGMLADLPPGTAVGLAAYGHRRETDCDDIEVLLPVGTHPRAALDAAIRRVQPRGMTPITAALQRVVEQLDRAAGPTHVVLVSDGKETCDGDPAPWCGRCARATPPSPCTSSASTSPVRKPSSLRALPRPAAGSMPVRRRPLTSPGHSVRSASPSSRLPLRPRTALAPRRPVGMPKSRIGESRRARPPTRGTTRSCTGWARAVHPARQ
jgi:hypothetical protein